MGVSAALAEASGKAAAAGVTVVMDVGAAVGDIATCVWRADSSTRIEDVSSPPHAGAINPTANNSAIARIGRIIDSSVRTPHSDPSTFLTSTYRNSMVPKFVAARTPGTPRNRSR